MDTDYRTVARKLSIGGIYIQKFDKNSTDL